MKNELLLISIATDSHRNIGCLSLFAVAEEAKISTNLLFLPKEEEYNEPEFSEFLIENQFKVVGISLTTRDFYFACKLTKHIRKYLPIAHITWGGIHPTCKPDESLEHADSICIGEGEIFLPELVKVLRNEGNISKISGIGLRLNENEIIKKSPSMVQDLNSLPFPRFDFDKFFVQDEKKFHKFDQDDYKKYSRHKGDGYVLLTSRSCPHRCTYCINSFINRLYPDNSSRLNRRLTVDNVLKEIKHAVNTIPSIEFINFMDDHFLTDKKWIDEFCEKYKAQFGFPFIIRATPGSIKEEQISNLKNAGLHTVQMGIQSGSKKTHKLIFRRAFNEERVVEAAKVLNSYKLECLFDFIIENDFETDEDRDKTIELMLKLPKPFVANLFVMTVFPETDLERLYKEKNMTPRVDPYSSNYFNFHENDFYYQLASLIPLIKEDEARQIFENRKDEKTLSKLKKLFLEKVNQTPGSD